MLTTESMLLENQLWHEQKISIWDSGQVSSDKKGNVRGQVNLKKQQNLRVGISIYRGAVTPDLLTSFWKWQKYHLLMLWITSKSVFTGTKHFHYGTENETFLETDREQGKLNNCLETCRRKINFDKVRTEFTACCKHHNKTCRCTAGYQGSSNHSCPKHIFTALKLLEVFNEWQWGSRKGMELSTGAIVEETSPLRVQEIEIRHTKQFALLSWSRNTSGEKRVKCFLGGCWCAQPVWPEISSPQGGLSGAQMRQSGAGLHHLHYQGSNCYQKYQMYSLHSSPRELWKQKDGSFLCCGLPVCIWMHSLHRHRVYLLPQGNPSVGADQDTRGVSRSFRQKKKKFQLQTQSGWSSLYKAKHLVNQNTIFYIHERAQIILIKMQQSDLYLLQSLRLINFKIPLVPDLVV